MIKVGINGFGRIGRVAFREMITSNKFDVVLINSTKGAEELAYLLKYDTVYKNFHTDKITTDDENIIINGVKKVKVTNFKSPIEIPWGEHGVDLVLDCTGVFTKEEELANHLKAGAKKVLISAPAKDDIVKSVVYGVNDNSPVIKDDILSASSCTTNALALVLNIIEANYEIRFGYINTVHAYTGDQNIVDGTHNKGINLRRGRAGAENIIPTSTGAAKEIGEIIPSLKGKVFGKSIRVPVLNGSLLDITLKLKKNPTAKEINDVFLNHVSDFFFATKDPVVSSDVIGIKQGVVVDLLSTEVLKADDEYVKILAWYDNELGYTNQLLKLALKMFE